MRFHPPHCPFPDCPAYRARPFLYRRKGFFLRKCDGRAVQRFACLVCQRSFSTQTFRLDYRLHRPGLNPILFLDFVSKNTQRQVVRTRGCTRNTVRHRLRLFGQHCQRLHQRLLRASRATRAHTFLLDELETFEHNRRLAPLTVPVLIERPSYFVLHAEVAPLPCRGRSRALERRNQAARAPRLGPRRSGSRAAVARCWEVLAGWVGERPLAVSTDLKPSYATSLRERFGTRAAHTPTSGRARRVWGSQLFAINHTFALLRDGLSRLVRRSWAVSKRGEWLRAHLWIWIAWRNYVRRITNRRRRETPAMVLGVLGQPMGLNELLGKREFPAALATQ